MDNEKTPLSWHLRFERYLIANFQRHALALTALEGTAACAIVLGFLNDYRLPMGAGIFVLFLSVYFRRFTELVDRSASLRAERRLYRWVERVRAYSVENIEALRKVTENLPSVDSPIPVEEALLSDRVEEAALHTKERNALLTIIGVLCKEAGIDYSRAAKSAAVIKDMADRQGVSIGDSTIEKHLKRVRDATESRTR